MVPDVDWRRPSDVIERTIDPESGALATPYCPQTKNEIFVAGTEPTSVCPIHAGSGEPSPFWRNGEFFPQVGEVPPGGVAPGQQPAPQPDRRREPALRRLLRRIFGQ
jgi:hypothetical protein